MKRDDKQWLGKHSWLYDLIYDYYLRFTSNLSRYEKLAEQSDREEDQIIYRARIADAKQDIQEMEDVLRFMEERYQHLPSNKSSAWNGLNAVSDLFDIDIVFTNHVEKEYYENS